MSHSTVSAPFPRLPLMAAAAAIAIAIVAAFVGRLTGMANSVDNTAPVAALGLRFEDRADGGVNIFDAANDRVIDVVQPGTNGFLRATLRGLANERKRESLGPDVPFRLTAWADGRLTLEDPATARLIDLGAFGQTNEAAFGQLLSVSERAK